MGHNIQTSRRLRATPKNVAFRLIQNIKEMNSVVKEVYKIILTTRCQHRGVDLFKSFF